MPYETVNLRYGVSRGETPVTCTAGIGTVIVEFGGLSRLTGGKHGLVDFFKLIFLLIYFRPFTLYMNHCIFML